jgi:hypothetical protein
MKIKTVPFKAFHLLLFVFILCSANVAYSSPLLDTTQKRLIVSYHANGKVKERGYQGHYANKLISTGAYVGTWNTYDKNGRLIQSVYYHNDIPAKAYIEKKKYYPNGIVKSMERFNNYELYESEIDARGTWKYFDNRGKLIKQISHEH